MSNAVVIISSETSYLEDKTAALGYDVYAFDEYTHKNLDKVSNIKYLKDNKVSIWDEWADNNGDLGHVYGYQWRSWPTPEGKHIDQITQVINTIKHNPDSRRIIVSAWNVGELEQMKLVPCHNFFQLYTRELSYDEKVD